MADLRRDRALMRPCTSCWIPVERECTTRAHVEPEVGRSGVMSVRSGASNGPDMDRHDAIIHRFYGGMSSRGAFTVHVNRMCELSPKMCTLSPQIGHSTTIRGCGAYWAKTSLTDEDRSTALVLRRRAPNFLCGSTPQAQ